MFAKKMMWTIFYISSKQTRFKIHKMEVLRRNLHLYTVPYQVHVSLGPITDPLIT